MYLFHSLFFFVFIVVYFSWISSPRFSLNDIVPNWIAIWADKHENDNIRTAIPLFFLGLVSGLFLILKRLRISKWLLCFILLIILVLIAELGQLLLPLRSFDWKDVFWGAIGAAAGLCIMYILKLLFKKEL